MPYRFVTEKENYEDYAAGRVLLSRGGMTSFPVRLASEIFQRCADYFPTDQRLQVYDPCCGGGYLLTVLGFMHGDRIAALHGSDIQREMVVLASDNLGLLTAGGLNTRKNTLQNLADTYHKSSHDDALDSADKLLDQLPPSPISTRTWVADALQQTAEPASIDLLICDVPYGNVTAWQADDDHLITALLRAQFNVLKAGGIAVVISDKSQKATYSSYTRLQQETMGKRRFLILQKATYP